MQQEKNGSLELKKKNRNRIYRFLYQRELVSKQEIANALHMSLPTVTQNLKDLLLQELIHESGTLESTGGRKAMAYSFVSDAKIAIGLDITAHHIGIVAVDLAGHVLHTMRLRSCFEDEDSYYERLGNAIKQFIADYQLDPDRILGVGIAVPAIVSGDHQKFYSTALGIPTGSIDPFAGRISYPCVLYNDANAAGFAEAWNTRMADTVVYLSLNYSVGGAFLVGQKIYNGQNQRGAEFGHMTIVPDGKPCYCGQKGCVNAYLSAHLLAECTEGNLGDFFVQLKKGNPVCQKVWQEYLFYLALTINNLRTIFDCDIVIGGYVGSYMADYLDDVKRLVSSRNSFDTSTDYLHICRDKQEATAVGAALHYVDQFLKQV
jgi:predicted NBD/HSP70 family sugar kinase